jgi:2-polyprenyl-3-methyl-5-hydroxy-6-metoxy-1,4-benzoquinol methylase
MKNNFENCMICGHSDHLEIANRVREGSYKVLKCISCDFIFLGNYHNIDYSINYGSLTLGSNWSQEEAVIKRSKSLTRFNMKVSELIETFLKQGISPNILEIGAGNGASIYGLQEIHGDIKIDCIELNKSDKKFLKERFKVNVFDGFLSSNTKYNIVYAHHVFEHFINPREKLNDLAKISTDDCKVYLSLPNFNDFYFNSLKKEQLSKYLEFNFHLAHPFYYTIETLSRLLEGSMWKIDSIETIQDYSILNYFNWYISGTRSKNIEEGTVVSEGLKEINDNFISMVEKKQMGNNLSVVITKIK